MVFSLVLLLASILGVPPPGPPSEEELMRIGYEDARLFEQGILSIEAPPFPVATRWIGLPACNAHWETRYGREQFGERVESTCYGLLDLGNAVLTEDWPEGGIGLVAVVYGSLEHLPDGTIQMWDIRIYVNDIAQAEDTEYPSFIFE